VTLPIVMHGLNRNRLSPLGYRLRLRCWFPVHKPEFSRGRELGLFTLDHSHDLGEAFDPARNADLRLTTFVMDLGTVDIGRQLLRKWRHTLGARFRKA
jgi:hypothetical protein